MMKITIFKTNNILNFKIHISLKYHIKIINDIDYGYLLHQSDTSIILLLILYQISQILDEAQ